MGLFSKLKSYFYSPLEEEQKKKIIEVQVSEAFTNTYDAISVISRCIDLIVDTAATIDFKIVQDVGWFDVPAKHNQFEKVLDNPSPSFGKFDFYRNVYRGWSSFNYISTTIDTCSYSDRCKPYSFRSYHNS